MLFYTDFDSDELEIGSQRDFKDFAIVMIYFLFLEGSNLGYFDPKVNMLSILATRAERTVRKKFKNTVKIKLEIKFCTLQTLSGNIIYLGVCMARSNVTGAFVQG